MRPWLTEVRCRVPVFLLILTLAAGVVRADPTDDYVKEQIDRFDLPGLSLVVVKRGEIVKAQGYGVADRSGDIPATPETVYKIGSVGKQFVATGIMLLVKEGSLSLDDPIGKYLTGTPASWAPIAIRHLLTHTSGLVRESPAFDPNKNKSDAELLRALHSVPLRFTPGEKWEYSNSGYIALAEIIRIVSGQPWTEYLEQNIFTPAGMKSTFPTNTAASIPNRAVGYGGTDNRRKVNEWVALRASGAFLSTVMDLAKWDALLYSDTILPDTARREMWTQVRLNDGKAHPYGLGWHVTPRNGRLVVWHGGGLPGFKAHFVRFVEDGISVAVLANGDDGDLAEIANGVARFYLGP